MSLPSIHSYFERLPPTKIDVQVQHTWFSSSLRDASGTEIKIYKIAGFLQWSLGRAIAVNIGDVNSPCYVYIPLKDAKEYIQSKFSEREDFNLSNIPLGSKVNNDPKNVLKLSHAVVRFLSQKPHINISSSNIVAPRQNEREEIPGAISTTQKKVIEQEKIIPRVGLDNPKKAYYCFLNAPIQALFHCISFTKATQHPLLKDIFSSLAKGEVPSSKLMERIRAQHNIVFGVGGDASDILESFLKSVAPIDFSPNNHPFYTSHPILQVPHTNGITLQEVIDQAQVTLQGVQPPSTLPISVDITGYTDGNVVRDRKLTLSPVIDVIHGEEKIRYQLRSSILYAHSKQLHYTTAVLEKNGMWTYFDDNRVSHEQADFEKVVALHGTTFLYERVESN